MLILMLMPVLISYDLEDFLVLSFVLPCAYAYAYVASEDQNTFYYRVHYSI